MTTPETIVVERETDVPAAIPEFDGSESAPVHQGILTRLRMQAGRERSWHAALLEAIGQWSHPNEHAHGRYWHYVIGGEALDWLTLAQRLCLEIPDAVPDRELEALLFHGRFPERVSPEQFRQMIGPYRYTALLNFHYGITVEETLQLLTEEAIRKNRLACCYSDSDDLIEEAYRHLYGDTRSSLALEFLERADGLWGDDLESFSLPGWHEFIYWLFKRRIGKWHPARVASDTRRGLELLAELQSTESIRPAGLFTPDEDAPGGAPTALLAGSRNG